MKSLSRPMFRRGGGISAKNNGIVSGFNSGGSVRQNYAESDPAGVQSLEEIARTLYPEATKPSGFSQSDYLRLAAAGADIMGAQPTGRSGFIGALQAASPALGSLGRDLGESMGEREQRYQDKISERDAFLRGAALKDAEGKIEFGRQKELLDIGQEDAKELLSIEEASQLKILGLENKNQIELQKLKNEGDLAVKNLDKLEFQEINKMVREQSAIVLDPESTEDEKRDARNAIAGALAQYTSPIVSKIDAVTAMEFSDQAKAQALAEGLEEGTVEFDNRAAEIKNIKIQQYGFEAIGYDLGFVFGFAKGGRVGLANGGDSYEERYREKELDPGPMEPGNLDPDQYPQQARSMGITFEELRARLPVEVSDGVVKLIATSEEALLDFANIETQEDISLFNQKYNTDLTLPAQVA